MSDSLEQAASAFDVAMGNVDTPRSDRSNDRPSAPTETMFGDVGNLEVDDESPVKGGGDDKPVEGEADARRRAEEALSDDDDVNAEADDEGDDADPEAGDEDADEDDSQDDVYRVTVDGKEEEVSLREALNGYIRTETFSRRMNELNDVRQAIRVEANHVLEDRKKYAALITDMEKHLNMLVPAEPDWAEEYTRDPQAAKALQQRYNEFNKTRAALAAEKERVQREQDEETRRRTGEYIDTENRRILANNPTWKDPAVMNRDLGMMMETAINAGFTKEEVNETYDSRYVTILLKAAKYDKLRAEKPKPIRRGNKPNRPGAGSTSTAPKGNKAMKELRRTGSIDAAANVFANIIDPKPQRRR